MTETLVWDESHWDRSVWGGETIPETLVLGEGRLGSAVLGGDHTQPFLESVLDVMSGGQFPLPGQRGAALTEKQRSVSVTR